MCGWIVWKHSLRVSGARGVSAQVPGVTITHCRGTLALNYRLLSETPLPGEKQICLCAQRATNRENIEGTKSFYDQCKVGDINAHGVVRVQTPLLRHIKKVCILDKSGTPGTRTRRIGISRYEDYLLNCPKSSVPMCHIPDKYFRYSLHTVHNDQQACHHLHHTGTVNCALVLMPSHACSQSAGKDLHCMAHGRRS
jgi:hypothetical protein